jgi:mannose-6-phosphate isomerase-like protein (cupin superfamily)
MKIHAMLVDGNGRSYSSFVDVPLNKVSDTEAISNKQEGTIWRIGTRHITKHKRTSKEYLTSGVRSPEEMHVGGEPHFIGIMSGHAEITQQDGSTWRMATGDFLWVGPGALHHSNNPSNVEVTIFNIYLPGTAADTQDPKFK